MVVDFLTIPTVAMLLIELVKWAVRKWYNPEFTFTKKFYLAALPVAEFIAPFVLFLAGQGDVNLVWSWGLLLEVVIRSLASVFLYEGAYKNLKNLE